MSDYKEIIIDHYKSPRNFGVLENPDLSTNEANASCGDVIHMDVNMNGKIIKEVRWQGVGCAISTAAASMLSEKAVGMSKADLLAFGEGGVVELLGGEVNPGRMKCATLAYRALVKILN
ncbi:MAG TPA: iron-sulfur cluster assembly scaffold protein [Patescibacteria group bacterium]